MGLEITKSLIINAPAKAVWSFLVDPARVAHCLPGAAITGQTDDRTYVGTMTVKVGPVVANYRGTLRFERLDEAAGEAELVAKGQETRGKGGADMRMRSRLVARGAAETELTVSSDVNVIGVLAQFGRGMIDDVSDQLFATFASCLRRELEASAPASVPVAELGPAASPSPASPPALPANPDPPPVLDVGALGAAAARRAVQRQLSRPALWIVIIILALLAFWWFKH